MADTARRYNVSKMREDMEAKTWLAKDLARAADVSEQTVSRLFRFEGEGIRVTTIGKLATALGYSVRRYLVRAREEASV